MIHVTYEIKHFWQSDGTGTPPAVHHANTGTARGRAIIRTWQAAGMLQAGYKRHGLTILEVIDDTTDPDLIPDCCLCREHIPEGDIYYTSKDNLALCQYCASEHPELIYMGL